MSPLKLPVVVSDVVTFPDFVSVQEPPRFVPLSPPLLLLSISNVTVKLDPMVSLRLAALGVLRLTTILILSVNVVCA